MKKILVIFLTLLIPYAFAQKSIDLKSLYEEGMNDMIMGQYEKGIILLRTVYVTNPKSPYAEKARFYVGYFSPDIFQQKVEYLDFLQHFKNSPFKEDIYYQLGLNNYAIQNFSASQRYFEEYLWNFPTGKYVEHVNFYLAIIAYFNGEYDVFETKMRKLVRDINGEFRVQAAYLLKEYYEKKGIKNKIKELSVICKDYPPNLKSNLSYYIIQVAAFIHKKGAEKVKRDLIRKKFKNVIVIFKDKYYKVLIRQIPDKDSAEKILMKLKKRGYDGRLIKG